MKPLKSELSKGFLLVMVCAMYQYEKQNKSPVLLTDAEIEDFYLTYMGALA
jgi:hypothetical protein